MRKAGQGLWRIYNGKKKKAKSCVENKQSHTQLENNENRQKF